MLKKDKLCGAIIYYDGKSIHSFFSLHSKCFHSSLLHLGHFLAVQTFLPQPSHGHNDVGQLFIMMVSQFTGSLACLASVSIAFFASWSLVGCAKKATNAQNKPTELLAT